MNIQVVESALELGYLLLCCLSFLVPFLSVLLVVFCWFCFCFLFCLPVGVALFPLKITKSFDPSTNTLKLEFWHVGKPSSWCFNHALPDFDSLTCVFYLGCCFHFDFVCCLAGCFCAILLGVAIHGQVAKSCSIQLVFLVRWMLPEFLILAGDC